MTSDTGSMIIPGRPKYREKTGIREIIIRIRMSEIIDGIPHAREHLPACADRDHFL